MRYFFIADFQTWFSFPADWHRLAFCVGVSWNAKQSNNVSTLVVHPAQFLLIAGTTWLQKIVWHIVSDSVHSEANQKSTIEDLFPYLEYSYPGLKEIAQRPSPRLMKSHMPYDLLPADVQNGKGKVRLMKLSWFMYLDYIYELDTLGMAFEFLKKLRLCAT